MVSIFKDIYIWSIQLFLLEQRLSPLKMLIGGFYLKKNHYWWYIDPKIKELMAPLPHEKDQITMIIWLQSIRSGCCNTQKIKI